MTTPLPEHSDLIQMIKDRLAESPLTEFDFCRFEHEAEKIKKLKPEIAFSALGVLACIRNDEETCRSYHEKSLCAAPLSSLMRHNFAVSLFRFGKLEEAAKMAELAVRMDRRDIRPAKVWVDVAYHLGDAFMIEEALKHWRKICGGVRHSVEDYLLEDAEDSLLVDAALEDVRANGTIPWEKFKNEELNA